MVLCILKTLVNRQVISRHRQQSFLTTALIPVLAFISTRVAQLRSLKSGIAQAGAKHQYLAG